MGWNRHGRHSTGCGRICVAPTYAGTLAVDLAGRSIRGRGDCHAGGCHQGASSERQVALGPRPEILVELRATDSRWWLTDVCALSRRFARLVAGRLAAAVWDRDRNRGRVFGASRADHGALPDLARFGGVVCPAGHGGFVYGARLRICADWIRDLDCPAARRIKRLLKSSSHPQFAVNIQCASGPLLAPSRITSAKPSPPIWTV